MAPPSLPQPAGRPAGRPRPSPTGRPQETGPLPETEPLQATTSPLSAVPAQASGIRLPAQRRPAHADGPREPHRTEAFDLPATPTSVAAARRTVRAALAGWAVDEDTSDNAVLVVSELVTNVLTHTSSARIVCRLRTEGGRLRIEVEDQNRGGTLPRRRQPASDDQNGRGLMLVGALSHDWGVRDTACGSGRVVWAELLLDGQDDQRNPAQQPSPVAHSSLPVVRPSAAVVRSARTAALPVRAAETPSREVALWAGAAQLPPWETASPLRPAVPPLRPAAQTAGPATSAARAAEPPARGAAFSSGPADPPSYATGSHPVRPIPHSAEGPLPHGPALHP
ncbi:ATP-binding protein [Streptomyces poonensis]|uniref:Histidine kinase/HSP90-like ATPase domain-containing protein n=1 Tax=Streptomyces poonensis TaxID=68255 RepID=A0A918PZU4_9ACTN|nr:ATP-binding protein [Streptomyces poonensis]GGZ26516.1 hypothetical protein GCM10010365_53630 [Streptomyces poonensis]GLJ88973.1 hypothetical protein GCM10017589_15730 [Streptomyces poonensis]